MASRVEAGASVNGGDRGQSTERLYHNASAASNLGVEHWARVPFAWSFLLVQSDCDLLKSFPNAPNLSDQFSDTIVVHEISPLTLYSTLRTLYYPCYKTSTSLHFIQRLLA